MRSPRWGVGWRGVRWRGVLRWGVLRWGVRSAGAGAVLALPLLVLAGSPGSAAGAMGGVIAGVSRSAGVSSSAATAGAAGRSVSDTGNMATITVGRLPTSVAVDSVSGTVWVVNSLDNSVSEISEARRAVVATIGVGVSPVDVAVDSKTATVWVTCLGPFGDPSADNTVSEISEATRKVVATIKVGLAPFGIAADPRTGTVWVANTNSSSVSEISEARRAVVATVPTGAGAAPVNVAVDQARGVVWVAKLDDAIVEISEGTRSVGANIRVSPDSVPGALNAIAVDAGTGAAWVTSDFYSGGSYVGYASAVTPAARLVRTGVLVSKPAWFTDVPAGIAVDPDTSTVWVAQDGADAVTLISQGTDSVARNLGTGDAPVAVAVDPRTGTVWIVNNDDGTVTEYSYASPQFTTNSVVRLVAGKAAAIHVRTRGFPVAVMRVAGQLPPGLRARTGAGTVLISGIPAATARNRTFHVAISADNGIGTASGQYVFTQQVTIQVG
jgi:YVTN family beta-propeller protein